MTESKSKDRPEETPAQEKGAQGPERETVLAILAYVPVLCLLPLLQEDRDPEMHRHARQGLVLFLMELLLVLLLIPGVSAFLLQLALVVCVVFAFFGAWNAWQGKFWRMPIIADLAEQGRAGEDQD